MRLIDADAIPWDVEGVGEIPVITKEEIDEMPTVDAVPVEWIEVDIEASAFSGYDIHAYEVASMLEEWKERNEE